MDWKTQQNADGGWSYGRRGTSWTEPTALVILAQTAGTSDSASLHAGLEFLQASQRPDGGWSPQPQVQESTWVTSVAALVPSHLSGQDRLDRAYEWLIAKTGRESTWQWKLQQRLAGNRDELPDGWPWFPGAAAWVIPTAFGILAFEKALRTKQDRRMTERVESGRRFLLARMCADGGWNHGGNRALGRDGDSYPETTGIALLALGAVAGPQLERAKASARRHLASCHTAEGLAWLSMGLAAHGERPKITGRPVCRTMVDHALLAMALADKNPLVS